jgi:hypothetical protein
MPLPPDPDSVEKWEQMRQDKPSRHALPPATGGMMLSRGLLLALLVFGILMVVLALLSGSRLF